MRKPWKKALAAALALAMSLSLAVTGVSAKEPAPEGSIILSTKDDASDDALLLDNPVFQLRGWDWSDADSKGIVTISKTTAEKMDLERAYAAPLGLNLTFAGDSEDLNVCIHAWTDADGDGIYDLRLFNDGNGELVPAEEAGPIKWSTEEDGYYTSEFLGNDTNNLDFSGQGSSDMSGQSLSTAWLTDQFGPNTLIQIETRKLSSETQEPLYY